MQLKKGKYTAIYLTKTAKILKKDKNKLITEVQFFQRNDNVILSGIKHSLELLKKHSHKYNTLKITSLKDGDIIMKNEPVLTITGNLWKFIHLEGVIDGILARESSIATNVRNVINVSNGKGIIYMNDRSDYYFTQKWDGYAAYVGGIRTFVTKKQIELLKDIKDVKLIGTVPHSLIQSFNGDAIEALKSYSKYIDNNNLTALVDYNNNVIEDSLKILKEFQNKIFAVRVDTSNNLIDNSLKHMINENTKNNLKGVNSTLAKELRNNLDKNGFKNVKIIFSSGLTSEKIFNMEKENAPIDYYGVGNFFSKIWINFTCDAVKIDNKLEAKFGRKFRSNERLKMV